MGTVLIFIGIIIISLIIGLIIRNLYRQKKINKIKFEATKNLNEKRIDYDPAFTIIKNCLSLPQKETNDLKETLKLYFVEAFYAWKIEELGDLITLCLESENYFRNELDLAFRIIPGRRLSEIITETTLKEPNALAGINDAKKLMLLHWYLHRTIQEYYLSDKVINELEADLEIINLKTRPDVIILRAEIAKIKAIRKPGSY
ncbi:MAG: hypothetical protein WCK37_03840 [Candidatus Falkowbacteria bacterium]